MNAKLKTTILLAAAGSVLTGSWFLTRAEQGTHAVAAPPISEPVEVVEPVVSKDNKIQIAILLDTSSSMSGLINQARSEIWGLVNELSTSTRNGSLPTVQIALYEYGKPALGAKNGYVRQVNGLTDDLDAVSESLFALTTNGGSEYAGYVIGDAVEKLEWNEDKETLKLIFIAGNEGFDQGPVDYRAAIANALEKGITVNTVFCGRENDSSARGWAHGAMLAKGSSMNIDHNHAIAHIAAPQDDEIARLSQELNSTYLAFGREGKKRMMRQAAQDKAASADPRMRVARAKSKASALYNNAKWDLVDAAASGASVAEMEEAALPEPVAALPAPQRTAYVKKMAKKRKELQARIKTLSKDRDAYVAKEKKNKPAGPSTLNEALLGAVKKEASKKGYTFEKK